MTVRDLLKQEIDIDVYDDYDERLGIAFCGPMELTKEGEKTFKDVLDLNVRLVNVGQFTNAIVETEDDEGLTQVACDLFVALAGYCSCEDYDAWFKEV